MDHEGGIIVRKLKLVKVGRPELVSCMMHDGTQMRDYQCPECQHGIIEEYKNCPYCGTELDWKNKDERSKEFERVLNILSKYK